MKLVRNLVLAATALGAEALGQSCTPHWEPFSPLGIGTGLVATLVVDDSGPGAPSLYVGGSFTTIGGVATVGVARWDGLRWHALGGGLVGGSSPRAEALALFDDDGDGTPSLYVGGSFSSAGGVAANNIARWDGSSWSDVGGGVTGTVYALHVHDDGGPGGGLAPALYAGGNFLSAGGTSGTPRIARWDGQAWSALASGIGGAIAAVFALASFDSDGDLIEELVAGGTFTQIGGQTMRRLALWDGSSWAPAGSGVLHSGGGTSVLALAVFDEDGAGPALPRLCVGGRFDTVGGGPASWVVRWDGIAWYPFPATGDIAGAVEAFAVYDDDGGGPRPSALYALGPFSPTGTGPIQQIARWSGSAWEPLGGGLRAGEPYAAAVFDPDGAGPARERLFAAGAFENAGDITSTSANRLGIASWDGALWQPLGGGLTGPSWATTFATATFDEDGAGPSAEALYVGGNFTHAGGRHAPGIARWDGSTWSVVGGGLGTTSGQDPAVYGLAVFDADGAGGQPPALYASGGFDLAGGIAVPAIAKWDGAAWTPVGSGGPGGTTLGGKLMVLDPDGAGPAMPALHAYGAYASNGLDAIWRWNGSSWSSVPGSAQYLLNDEPIADIAMFDADGPGPDPAALYATGHFTSIGGVAANGIARFDGASWHALGSGLELVQGGGGAVGYALAVFDEDGAGPLVPRLQVGGHFDRVGGVPTNGWGRWDGSSWSGVGFASSTYVYSDLLVLDPDGTGPGAAALHAAIYPASGSGSSFVSAWDGGPSWTNLQEWFGEQVYVLGVYDDDAAGPHAPSLHAFGNFGSIDAFQTTYHPTVGVARRIVCGDTYSAFCAGDGSLSACPCANNGNAGRGCQNSAGTGGAALTASGTASLTSDTLRITSTGELPSATSVFVQSRAASAPVSFGDGLRCVGNPVTRLYTKPASGGTVAVPTATDLPISARSLVAGDAILPGQERVYQVIYRDVVAAFCAPPAGGVYNTTNALRVTWSP